MNFGFDFIKVKKGVFQFNQTFFSYHVYKRHHLVLDAFNKQNSLTYKFSILLKNKSGT